MSSKPTQTPFHAAVGSLNQMVRIILVEPAGSLNVGSIARVMKNMGLCQLTLVNPKCDRLGEEARRMAVHALDVLQMAQVVQTLPEALQGCQRAVATTARDRDLTLPVDVPSVGLRWLLDGRSELLSSASSNLAILFGPEDRGLSNTELVYAQRLITIPTNPDYASLNLAQAVAICCYELSQLVCQETIERVGQVEKALSSDAEDVMRKVKAEQNVEDGVLNSESSFHDPTSNLQHSGFGSELLIREIVDDDSVSRTEIAALDQLERYYQQLEAVLLRVGYLYPHTVKRRMEKFRVLFNRSRVTHNEMAMLRGMLRQISWALDNAKKQTDKNESRD